MQIINKSKELSEQYFSLLLPTTTMHEFLISFSKPYIIMAMIKMY